MNKFKWWNIGVVILHWTWGILQTLVGFIGFLIFINRRHVWVNGSVCTEVKGNWGGITLGMFTFVDDISPFNEITIKHEYGHSLQSILLGPIWILVIAIPSLLWASCGKGLRLKYNHNYYWLYCERWADAWGGVVKRYY